MVLKLKQRNIFFLRCRFLACERHNLHNDLCLINPPVISFDGESINNLYKINKEILLRIIPNRADVTGLAKGKGGGRSIAPTFLWSKNKKGKRRKSRKSFKAETIKRVSPRWKCYYFSNVYYFILERQGFKYFSVFHDPSTLKSISRALPNLALMCAALHRRLISLRCKLGGIFSYVLLLVITFF